MRKLFTYFRSLWPMASAILWPVWMALMVIGAFRWFNGSFVPLSSVGDATYRFLFLIFGTPLMAFGGAATCDLLVRLKRKLRLKQ